jgi:hypothetical protein
MGFARFRRRFYGALGRRFLPSPVDARHREYSMLYSEDDSKSRPTRRLLDIGLESAKSACAIDLSDIVGRVQGRLPFPDEVVNLWPGEHYRLLAGLVKELRPCLVVEIGTAEGLSALSLLKFLPEKGKVVTFDIVPWREYPGTCLNADDFASGRLEQQTGDLSRKDEFLKHQELLRQAELIFVDAPKDGVFERPFIINVESIRFPKPPIFIFDDVRLWNMLGSGENCDGQSWI